MDNTYKPLFIELSKKLKNRILTDSGNHETDWMLPTLKKLSIEYNVSLVTIKKAVDILAGEGLTYSRPGLGIKVNIDKLQRYKTESNAPCIGLIFLDIFNQESMIIGEISHGIVEVQKQSGFELRILSVPGQNETCNQWKAIENFLGNGIDGLLIASRMPVTIISRLKEKKIPFVWIGNYIEHEDIHAVIFDKNSFFLKAVEKMQSHGITRAVYIAPASAETDRMFFQNLCLRFGINLTAYGDGILKADEDIRKCAVAYTHKALNLHKPQVIICGGELTANSVLKTLLHLRLGVPDDMRLIVFMERRNAGSAFPVPAEIFEMLFYRLAEEAALMLCGIIGGREPATHVKYITATMCKTDNEIPDISLINLPHPGIKTPPVTCMKKAQAQHKNIRSRHVQLEHPKP